MAKQSDEGVPVLGVAAVAAAAAVAGAGAYWLYGAKDAAKNRRVVRSWMLKARGEVLEAVEQLQFIDKAMYLNIVQEVVERYKQAGAKADEIRQVVSDLQDSWKYVRTATPKKAKKAVKKATKAVKKAAKKAK